MHIGDAPVLTSCLVTPPSQPICNKIEKFFHSDDRFGQSKCSNVSLEHYNCLCVEKIEFLKSFIIKLKTKHMKYKIHLSLLLLLLALSCGKIATQDFNEDYSTMNLSYFESANCYIVSEAGKYKFKTVKGNSSTSVGNLSTCEVLWESFGTSTTPTIGDLIKGVTYKDGYIEFETASTFREGNAVIAVKDASGTILWSWHIWLTDQPQGHTYNNGAVVMMDRNLGATSATPGDVGALGLLYQWGRKDPFLGSSSISDDIEAKSTITWPS